VPDWPMLLSASYSLNGAGRIGLDLPFRITLPEGVTVTIMAHEEQDVRLTVEQRIDPTDLEAVPDSGIYRSLTDGTRVQVPALRLKNAEPLGAVAAHDVMSAIAFLTDARLALGRLLEEDRFIPEADSDRAVLNEFGTDLPYAETSVVVDTRTFVSKNPSHEVVRLMSRQVGLRIYADALLSAAPVARFRELWRVLESAFGCKERTLVKRLAEYRPAQQLGFTEPELDDLRILRGKASHAESSAGMREVAAVQKMCREAVPRLNNLAERVILTKKSWGNRTLATDEVLPLVAWVGHHDSNASEQ